jgi:DNA polymerase-3 subunit gamma/tau
LKYKQGNHLELVLSPSYAQLNTVANKERLQEALTVYFGTPQTINIEAGRTEAVAETPAQKTNRQTNERQQYAVDAIMNDPNIQQLQQLFGARVKQEAIKLIETKPETV